MPAAVRSGTGPVRVGVRLHRLAQLEIAARHDADRVAPLAARLHDDAVRYDLPEFLAWALVYQVECGDRSRIPLARNAAEGVTNPVLQARVRALDSDT
jgi:hypothetical protein